MEERDLPDTILSAELLYGAFKDEYTGLPGRQVPLYKVEKTDGTFETITKQEYFRRVLVLKVAAKRREREQQK